MTLSGAVPKVGALDGVEQTDAAAGARSEVDQPSGSA
ncbi:hypothetical protein SANTM175S_03408 [Streptomyces antimycoticus]